MGLGNRNATRHETEGTRKTAGVRAEDYWDYKPGQTVMTVDGFLGKVTAVEDGPFAGSEQYQVTLLNNMGGGIYTSSQLRASSTTTAAADHEAANTAARDYPELAEILEKRPDPGKYPSSTMSMYASREDPQNDTESMKYHGRDDTTELREDMGLPPLEAAGRNKGACDGCGLPMHYSRETGKITWHIPSKGSRGAAFKAAHDIDDTGIDSGDDLWHFDCPECGYSQSEYQDAELAKHLSAKEAGGAPGLCENGHLTWGGHCPSCRNAGDANSMVTNPGDHKPQDVEHTKNASQDPAYDDSPYNPDHYDADDDDDLGEQMVHCPNCGQWKGRQSHFHPGNDGPCPNASESEDDIFDRLSPEDYCGEHCQSAHASDIKQGVMGHHTFRVGEPEFAENGTGLANTTGPYDAPASRDSNYEVRDPSEAGLCHYCRKPLMGSVGDQIDSIADPRSEHFLKSNPTGPTKYSSVMPIEQTHTRTVPDEDDGWDQYLVTRCGEHGTSVVGDRPSQEAYIAAAKGCRDASYSEGMSHKREHDYDGSHCWSCCPDMYVATPGEKESGRTAALRFGRTMIALAQNDPDLGFHLTAAWRDVRNKAKRIRSEGGVHITTAQNGYVIAQVKGDHGTYESVLMRVPGTQKVGQWDCGCKWATYHWGAPDDYSRFAGRMCSHALALNFEAQSRGMFGREVKTDQGVPRWLNQGDFDRTASLGMDLSFMSVFATLALAEGESPEAVAQMLASVNSPFGEPGPSEVPTYPATMPKNPSENPASAGFLTASDPASWSNAGNQVIDRMGSRDDSLFEPDLNSEATLNDAPEPALPSTDGAADDDEDMFGSSVTASIDTGVEYSVPSDAGNSTPAQTNPGLGLKDVSDDALSPEDPSMQTVGSVEDIVAQFQRTAGAAVLNAGPGAAAGDTGDIAAAAKEFLAKESMAVFSPAEQQALINEGEGSKAANLDRLQIEGTHYEALDAALAKQDGDDEEEWMA